MNIDMNQPIRSSDIEFMTTYPKMGGHPNEKVLLIVARTAEGYRYLIYAPRVVQRETGIEHHIESVECRGPRGTVLSKIPYSRNMTINNELYVLPDEDKDTVFNLIFLDQQPAQHVKKGDIEKLFGCVIDG